MFFIINPKVETMPDADNNEILTPIEEIKKEYLEKIDYFGSCLARDDKTSDDIFKELNKE